MKPIVSHLGSIVIALLTVACTLPTPPTEVLLQPLEPAEFPSASAEYEMNVSGVANSEFTIWQSTSEASAVNYVENGCEWIKADLYGPVLSWRGCDDADGIQTIDKEQGSLWPMQVGAEKTWVLFGRNAKGQLWWDRLKCKVTSAVSVQLNERAEPAFRIRCDSDKMMRIFWHAPRLGHVVYYQEIEIPAYPRTRKLGHFGQAHIYAR